MGSQDGRVYAWDLKTRHRIGVSPSQQAYVDTLATVGDAKGERTGAFDFVARARFDAWNAVAATTAEEAMQKYIDLVASLKRVI